MPIAQGWPNQHAIVIVMFLVWGWLDPFVDVFLLSLRHLKEGRLGEGKKEWVTGNYEEFGAF